jgi:solute carrier family 35 (UDP-sugar transporter), member A1/2/3
MESGGSSCDGVTVSSCTTAATTATECQELLIDDDDDDDDENKSESSNDRAAASASSVSSSPSSSSYSFQLFLLALMVVQTSSNVLVGRYSRSAVPAAELYEVNHAVMGIEVTKFVLACILEHCTTATATATQRRGGGKQAGSSSSLLLNLQIHVVQRPRQALQMIIPAMLYLVQNTLLYVALTNLTAPMFCVTYQGKLVTTAMVSVVMLRRSYSMQQWICILAISLGVAIVVNGEQQQSSSSSSSSATDNDDDNVHRNLALGLTAVCISCFTAALAGVYFEKILKNTPDSSTSNNGSGKSSSSRRGGEGGDTSLVLEPQASLWMRNIQLAFFSILLAAAQGGLKNTGRPYFYGFNAWTYLLIFIQAVGGLLVAAVIKYADNVLKGLATGVSVVLSSLLSWLLFRTRLTVDFMMGGTVILLAVWFFGQPLPTWLTAAVSSIHAWFVRGDDHYHATSNKKDRQETELFSLLPK